MRRNGGRVMDCICREQWFYHQMPCSGFFKGVHDIYERQQVMKESRSGWEQDAKRTLPSFLGEMWQWQGDASAFVIRLCPTCCCSFFSFLRILQSIRITPVAAHGNNYHTHTRRYKFFAIIYHYKPLATTTSRLLALRRHQPSTGDSGTRNSSQQVPKLCLHFCCLQLS